jgi:hypothetical protein
MPFEWQPYRNPYTGTIAELMGVGGHAHARALEVAGQAQANAAMASGAAWSGAAQNIGQIIGAIPQQIQHDKAVQQDQQMRDLQLKEAQRQDHSRTVFEQELKNPENYKADGTIDDAKITERLRKADVGAWQQWNTISAANAKNSLELRAKGVEINKNIVDTQEKQQQLRQAQSDYLGRLAYHATDVLKQKADDPLHARDTTLAAVARAAADGAISETDANNFLAQTAAATPAQLQQVFGAFVSPELQGKLEKEAADTGKAKSDADKAAAEAENMRRYGATTPPSLQSENVMYQGKPTQVTFDPRSGKRTAVDGQGRVVDVTGQTTPIPPASVQVMNAAGNIKPEDDPVAKAIADYRVPPPSPRSMTSPEGEALMRRVSVLNPDYDASQFPTRQKMRQAFTSGAQGQAINSLNTAIIHLDQFVDVAKALDNGNFRPGNEFFNRIKATFGDSAPTNFDGLKTIMSGELASAFKKSGATDTEIHDVKSAISSSNSTKQLVDYVTTIAIPALGGKTATYTEQYRQVMGENDPFKILLPDAVKVLTKYGLDPDHPSMGSDGKKTPVALTPGLQRVMERP